ncbi:MAG: hypothetical protein QNJ56_09395 [Gammaproteobacteria bacterium]|nr:hypothetical protein [Gammaproteobacteria bacterium]
MAYYFIYKITQMPGNMFKQLEKIDRFDVYKEAKKHVKQLRNDQSSEDLGQYRIIFAESELAAEEQLQEKREAPIIQEWEK